MVRIPAPLDASRYTRPPVTELTIDVIPYRAPSGPITGVPAGCDPLNATSADTTGVLWANVTAGHVASSATIQWRAREARNGFCGRRIDDIGIGSPRPTRA